MAQLLDITEFDMQGRFVGAECSAMCKEIRSQKLKSKGFVEIEERIVETMSS